MLTIPNEKILQTLKSWLLELECNKGLTDIDPDENLIEQGLIDSLEFVNFLLLVEEQRGEEIPSIEIELEKFKTLNTILKNYF